MASRRHTRGSAITWARGGHLVPMDEPARAPEYHGQSVHTAGFGLLPAESGWGSL